ncbi:MAG: choice-of-anchor B family protein [Phycisphaerae bacterium]|nr:choice-of-anchor B family protein [Phycisphaerae bacterium]
MHQGVKWAGRVALVAGLAGVGASAWADDDDKMLRDRKPAVVGPMFRGGAVGAGADAWKLATPGPVAAGPDSTFPQKNIALKAWIPLNNFPGFAGAGTQTGADCWGYVSPSGREYALIGLGWGTGVVEVTDPSSPTVVTVIPGPNSLWHDVDVIGHYAYAVTDSVGVGIQVIDLASVDSGVVTLVRNFSQGGHATTHTGNANPASGFIYMCGGNIVNGGIMPCATTPDPTFPTFTGPGWTTQYVHEAQIVNYTNGPYAGKEIAFLFAGGPYYGYSTGLAVVDFTNKAAPTELSRIAFPGLQFCHQGWISTDRKYLYVDDELDGPGGNQGTVPYALTRVFDITDLANPRMVSAFTNGLSAVDHNQYTTGRYLYQSNYTSGLRVWDLTNPLAPTEVAWIDTHPEHNNAEYAGSWGNYPYFPSGTAIISDLQRGLFVVRLSMLEMSSPSPAPAQLMPGVASAVSVRIDEKEATLASATVMVSVNGGPYTPIALEAQGGGVYGAGLPALSCRDRVRFYFKATATDAREFVWPLEAPARPFEASVHESRLVIFADDFETDRGWAITNNGLSAGAWTRGVPLHNGGPGAVIRTADGTGACLLTGAALNEDVDGGPTTATSPALNLAAYPEARVDLSAWMLSVQGSTDAMTIEVSNGGPWTTVRSIGPASGAWSKVSFRVADFVAPSATTRIRVSVADVGDDSTTEAGLDDVVVWTPGCACYANCDGSTTLPVLNVNDFVCFQNKFAAGDLYANCDGSVTPPVLNVNDFVCYLNAFAAGCP